VNPSSNERERLLELAALDLGADIDDPALQQLVERAAHDLGLPIAAVSIVLDSAQYFIASHGLSGWIADARGTPREWAFCERAVVSKQPYIVEDASRELFAEGNPLVESGAIGCYLGYPLRTRNDQVLGTLCVLGVRPRSFSQDEIDQLGVLADRVMAVLETRRVR
jgi:GAF domain-containing protein